MIPKNFIARTLTKYYTAHETPFQILKFSEENNPPNIYGERINKVYEEPIECFGFVEIEPTEVRLEELGWRKESVQILITVPFVMLVKAGLANEEGKLLFGEDDKIVLPNILDKPYFINKIMKVEPFIQNKPTLIVIGGRNYQ